MINLVRGENNSHQRIHPKRSSNDETDFNSKNKATIIEQKSSTTMIEVKTSKIAPNSPKMITKMKIEKSISKPKEIIIPEEKQSGLANVAQKSFQGFMKWIGKDTESRKEVTEPQGKIKIKI